MKTNLDVFTGSIDLSVKNASHKYSVSTIDIDIFAPIAEQQKGVFTMIMQAAVRRVVSIINVGITRL